MYMPQCSLRVLVGLADGSVEDPPDATRDLFIAAHLVNRCVDKPFIILVRAMCILAVEVSQLFCQANKRRWCHVALLHDAVLGQHQHFLS
eukprot:CAMPEP_0180555816 /NCGR_PEP_ID=MMETSP1037_2-20121125/204_1 /TAXON_ID=632150 /ORGANISM="Azadinium spinosum, Strain 3D9" /LENGTH=89 /DNA_ID=CAMNT_0022571725 /DNA_START=318 /DNA_END=587 /DNA_ORIENTATION=+